MLDADAQKDIGDGAVDPRMLAVLDKLTEKHKIELSVIKTGHDQFTSGGSVSNHFVGRGIDIARVDGEIVNPGSTAARELATEIAALTGDLRPTEVGTPFPIGAPGFFTDGAHQDHIHVAFDGEPPGGLHSAPRRRRGAAAAAAAAVPGQPVAAAAAAEPKVDPRGRWPSKRSRPKAAERAGQGRLAGVPGGDQAEGRAGRRGRGRRRRGPPRASTSPGVSDAYPGDNASREQIAAWMARPGARSAGCRPSCR